MKYQIKQHFQIESARRLPHLPSTHPCSQVHGHSFKIILTLEGPLDPVLGWMMDYNDIAKICKPTIEQIDHRYLNEVPGLENPTSELLAFWIFNQLQPLFAKTTVGLQKVTVLETPFTECSYGHSTEQH